MNILGLEAFRTSLTGWTAQTGISPGGGDAPVRVPVLDTSIVAALDNAYGGVFGEAFRGGSAVGPSLTEGFVQWIPESWLLDVLALAPVQEELPQLFVRRVPLSRGALIIFDDPAPDQLLIFSTEAQSPFGLTDAVVKVEFSNNQLGLMTMLFPHCNPSNGCQSRRKRCSCTLVRVLPPDGDEAWACRCDNHGSP
jgi:hypothetical protein